MPGSGVVALSEDAPAVLSGAVHEMVVPLVDGTRTADNIVAELSGRATPEDVNAVLADLTRRELVDVANSTRQPLRGATVTARAMGAVALDGLEAALASMGAGVGDGGAVEIVATDDYLRTELRAFNAESLNRDRSWLLVKPVGSVIWLGPLFRPDGLGCWECLAQRLRDNRPIERHLQPTTGDAEPLTALNPTTPASLGIAWSLATTTLSRWVADGGVAELDGGLMTFDVATGQTTRHAVVWRPQCAACGEPDASLDRSAAPIVLRPRPKTSFVDGGHRVVPPERTLERFSHHVSPITGVVPELERMAVSASNVLHVYRAGQDHATRQVLSALGIESDGSSAGKGATDAQARASALCEALERYSSVFRGGEPRRRAHMSEFGDAAIHPNDCMRFSERQYARRAETNDLHKLRHFVPIPFDPAIETDWTPVWSLTSDEVRYLPTAFCYFRYSPVWDEAFCLGDSNGNAAGNTIEEAILQGFLELVERDAAAVWWYNRIRRPAVDLRLMDDRYIAEVQQYYHEHDRDLWVLDLETDLQIPVYVAVSAKADGTDVRLGYGAHIDAKVAVSRAISEVNQMLTGLIIRGGHEDRSGPVSTVTLADHPHLVPEPVVPGALRPTHAWRPNNDIRDDVLACMAVVEQLGMELLVVDQSRPDIGLPVVKVIVPGLRHFWPRFADGRLYDVPVTQGWLSKPITEEELNPVPIPT